MTQASIGTQLKDARTKKTLSLEDVHGRIKIHPRVLQLLEEDKFDKLPSPLFAKSFLKSYAEFLEINSEEIVEAYEKGDTQQPEQILFIRPIDQRPAVPSAADRKSTALVVVVGIAAALLFVFGLYILKHHAPAAPARSAARPQKEKVSAKRTAASAASVTEAKKPSDWLRSTDDGNFPKIPSGTPLKLGVRSIDTVWLKVTCDEKVLFQGLLKKGAAESWSAKDSIELWSGNASNMILSVNGMSIGSPGKGVVKKMLVTRQGVRSAS